MAKNEGRVTANDVVATIQTIKLLLLITNGWLMVNNNNLPAYQQFASISAYIFASISDVWNSKLSPLQTTFSKSLKRSKSAPMTSQGPVSIHGVDTADVRETDPSLTFNMQEIAACEGTWKHPEHLINNTYQNCS